jgi:hypothetical protein
MLAKTQTAVRQYIYEILGVFPRFSTYMDVTRLPFTIRGNYDISELNLLGQKFIAFLPKSGKAFSAAKIAKHFAWIDRHYDCQGVFITQGLEAYNRKRLIEKKVPFIIPGNQFYLPDIGFDLRENLRKFRQGGSVYLSPTAQVVVLAKLLNQLSNEIWATTILAKIFETVSKMTKSRVTEELERHGLIEVRQKQREKQIHFKENGRMLWEKSRPLLRSPIQKRVYADYRGSILGWGTIAGLNALSELTMIARPDRQVRALTSSQWNIRPSSVSLKVIPESSNDLANIEFEIWKYDPLLLRDSGIVDPLSLYLSLADTDDERIESALDELLENMSW